MRPSRHPRDPSRRALAVLVAPALAAGVLAAGAGATRHAQPTLSVNPAHVARGATLVLHGHGFPRNAHIVLRAGPRDGDRSRIGEAQTGRRGSFVAPVDIDAHVAPGAYVAVACHARCRVKAAVRFRVVRP